MKQTHKGQERKVYTKYVVHIAHTHREATFTFHLWLLGKFACILSFMLLWLPPHTPSPSHFFYFCRLKCKAQHLIWFLFVFVVVRSQESPFLLHSVTSSSTFLCFSIEICWCVSVVCFWFQHSTFALSPSCSSCRCLFLIFFCHISHPSSGLVRFGERKSS